MARRQSDCRQGSVLLAAATSTMSYSRIPQLLASAGLQVAVLAPSGSPGLASSYVSDRLPVDGGASSVRRCLRSLIVKDPERYDWVVVCDEELISELSSYLNEPWAASCFPVPAGDAAQIISQKTSFIAACQQRGIAVPESCVCLALDDAFVAVDRIGFPVIVKANFGASGSTIWRVDDTATLVSVVAKACGQPFLVQQMITGDAGVTEMVCSRGRPIAVVSSVMRGIDPPPFGPASSRLYRKNPAAERLAGDIAALTKFHGLCGFDWIQCGQGHPATYVLEFHPRPTLGFHMAKAAGVDFAQAVRSMLAQGEEPLKEQPRGLEKACYFFPKDLTRALKCRDVPGVLRWVPGFSINDFPWNDRGLLWALTGRLAGRVLRPRSQGPLGPILAAESTAFRDDI